MFTQHICNFHITIYMCLFIVVTISSIVMACGCFIRSGLPWTVELPSYEWQVVGTVLVGAAQPMFQCTPPLLSATWFGPKERALSTAVAINFNQVREK
jgi:hypothetical protein